MENVYEPRIFGAKDPIKMKEYFKKYAEECRLYETPPDESVQQQRQKLFQEEYDLPLELQELDALEDLCSLEKLKVANENPELPLKTVPRDNIITAAHPINKEAKVLETVQCKEVINVMKYDANIDLRTNSLGITEPNSNSDSVNKDIRPGSTFLYKIMVYVPFNSLMEKRVTPDIVRAQYKIEALGSNTLLELANIIQCVSDHMIFKEVEAPNVDLNAFLNAKEKYPSRCFFIENVFYNDTSNPNAIDYSVEVRKWAMEKDIGEFTVDSMEHTRLDSLAPRMGYAYVYIHQGDCEHIIIFADARMIQGCDCLVSQKYPRVLKHKRASNFMCFQCGTVASSWMVRDSDRLPIRRAFFCDLCLNSCMFRNGEKLGKFDLFPYANGPAFAQLLQDSAKALVGDESDEEDEV